MNSQDAPNEIQKTIDELKKQKELLEAEKARLDAEKAKIDSAKALTSAEKPDANVTEAQNAKNRKDLLEAQKSLIDAQRALERAQQPVDTRLDDLKNQKAMVDAQKDLANSQTDALKAQLFGTVTGGSFSGAVEMKTNAGVAEANLLASQAIRCASARIAEKIKTATSGVPIFLFNVKDFPTFQRLAAFRFRKEVVKEAYKAINVGRGGEEAVEAIPALASGALDTLSKILGFLKSDFSVGGTEVKADDSQLVFAMAGSLSSQDVHLPGIYNPSAHTTAVSRMTGVLADLAAFRINANTEMKTLSDSVAQLANGSDAQKKEATVKSARLEQLKNVVALHDAFLTSLTTPDSGGTLPIVLLAQEFAIDDALQAGGTVLLVKLENAAGGYFVKKNLLTGLGAMPLYHMGGSSASYLLLRGNDGKVLASDVVPVHGGFVKAGKVEDELKKTPK